MRQTGRHGPRRRRGRGRRLAEPREPGRLRAAVGVLPVVAAAVVEARGRRRAGSARSPRIPDVDDAGSAAIGEPYAAGRQRHPGEVGQRAAPDEVASPPRGRAPARGPRPGARYARDRERAPRRRRRPAPGRRAWPQAAGRAPARRRRSSIARMRSTCARTVRAWRPAIEPIETWSSWLALVGIESTTPGGPAPCSRTRGRRPCTAGSSSRSRSPMGGPGTPAGRR